MHPGDRRTYGHSIIVDPWGEIVASCEEGEAVIIAEFDKENMQDIRQRFPALIHRRL